MLSTIEAVNSVVNNFIWGVPAMICIIGVGLYLSIRTRFLQIRKFPYAMKVTLGRMMKKKEASDGALTPFQAVCTALAATVGTGNVAGVAGAIAIGGPGAVLWMWVSALLGMCTKFAEVTLAVHFRETNAQGDLVGGPMYYIKNGLDKKWHFLAYFFAAFGVLAVFGTGNATQVNTITTAIDSALSSFNALPADAVKLVNLIIGVALAIIIALILIGGIKRIGAVAEKLVPVMSILYIIFAFVVIFGHAGNIGPAFAKIFRTAFTPKALGGAASGKSEYAESLVLKTTGPRYYLATMQVWDAECAARVEKHRKMRAAKQFETVECPLHLDNVRLPARGTALLEDLGNLAANELYDPAGAGENAAKAILHGLESLAAQCENLIVVSNEVFSGGADYAGDTGRYLLALAQVNNAFAARADAVVRVVCGIPVYYKGVEK